MTFLPAPEGIGPYPVILPAPEGHRTLAGGKTTGSLAPPTRVPEGRRKGIGP
jgi:hypothetical protein